MSTENEHSVEVYWGVCPECRSNDGCINIGKGHWYYCKEHKKKWYVGSNLFSSWKEQSEEQQREIYDRLEFGAFETIQFSDTQCRVGA